MYAYSIQKSCYLSNVQNAYCVGGDEGYGFATLQYAEEEIYEASGHCKLTCWRRYTGRQPGTALRTEEKQIRQIVAATNTAPQEGVDSLLVGRIGEATPSTACIE